MNTLLKKDRVLGGLYGSLVGDALGVPVEFASRRACMLDSVVGMRSDGAHGQRAGTWSDDGALLLCSVESLVEKGFDTSDMGARFVRWYHLGLWSAHGTVFDIGNTTRQSLDRISRGVVAEQAGGHDQYDNGNGSLMRILPVSLALLQVDLDEFRDRLQRASAITHGHLRSQMACVFHGLLVRSLMEGLPPQQSLEAARGCFGAAYEGSAELSTFRDVLGSDIAQWPEEEVHSGGYVMETLTASLWCLLTTDSFTSCVLKAVNPGGDTDTTGCVAGGLAGMHYGLSSIPECWRDALPRSSDLATLFSSFVCTISGPP
jgi:ADP-ribosylglycohydrolase